MSSAPLEELPDPDLSHIRQEDYDEVYEPSADTFLVMECLSRDRHELQQRPAEVGVGTGVLGAYAALNVGVDNCRLVGVDLNPKAVEIAQETYRRNGIDGEVLKGNLAVPLLPELANKIDCLLFNPPYVPTDEEELRIATGVNLACAGGPRGRLVVDRFLPQVPKLLSSHGVFYLVTIEKNKPKEIEQALAEL